MKSVLAFLAVNAFFVALNALGAALIFGLFKLGQLLVPGLMEEPFFVYPLGLLAIGATIACAFVVISRLGRGRAGGRA